jgi:hypothetical protein
MKSESDNTRRIRQRRRIHHHKTKGSFSKYLFKPGEKWTHIDEFGNIWYEDINTK